MEKNIRVLFITGKLNHYRVPFLDFIGKKEDVILTVAHSGDKITQDEYSFKELILKEKQFYKFTFHEDDLFELCNHFDVVVAMFYIQKISFVKLSLIKKRNFKLIYWGHGIGESKIGNLIRKYLSKKVDALITYDQQGKNNLLKLNIPDYKIFVANNTISVNNSKDTSQMPKDSLLFVGRIQKRKELDLLLYKYKEIKHLLDPSLKIVILGNGGIEKDRLIKLAFDLDLQKNVVFIQGTTDEKSLLDVFSKAYAYVSFGAVGLSVVHSFAYGVPVITLKNRKHGPEFNNIINDINGVIIEKEEYINDSILSIFRNNKYQGLGRSAYNHFKEKRQIEHMVNGFIKAIYYAIKN